MRTLLFIGLDPHRIHGGPGVNMETNLHGSSELSLILHGVLCCSSLDTGQDGRLEEVPPVLVEHLVEELKHLRLNVRGGPLRNSKVFIKPCSHLAFDAFIQRDLQ